jgi:hypothetical protein
MDDTSHIFILVYKGYYRKSKKNGGESLKSDCLWNPG